MQLCPPYQALFLVLFLRDQWFFIKIQVRKFGKKWSVWWDLDRITVDPA
jgi:hypothetical protein